MKRFLLIIVIVLLCGCSKNRFTELEYDKLYDKMSSYDNYVIYFCNDTDKCQSFNDVLNRVIKDNGKRVYYLNTSNLGEKERMMIEGIYFDGTNIIEPSILIVEKGIVKSRQLNIVDYDTTKEFLK